MTEIQQPKKFEINKNIVYEITIVPNDQHQFPTYKSRLQKTTNTIKEIIENTQMKYNLRLEISMPQFGDKYKNTIARIHYHGIILFPHYSAVRQYLIHDYQKLTAISRIQLNYFRPKEWIPYIKKHKPIFHLAYNYKINNMSIKHIIQYDCSQEKRTLINKIGIKRTEDSFLQSERNGEFFAPTITQQLKKISKYNI